MHTKLLMASSAIGMGVLGISASFLPHEILVSVGANPAGFSPLVIQVLGALYIAFGMINWTTKANVIGGIYGRPVAMGNALHFSIGALALVKGLVAGPVSGPLVAASGFYAVFAIWFLLALFRHPANKQ